MDCAQVCDLLGDHLEGTLELSVRAQLDAHVASCPTCGRELRELRSIVALLRSLPDPPPPSDLVETVMEQVRGEGRAPVLPLPVRRLFDPRVAAPLAAGISALVLFATMQSGSLLGPQVATDTPAPALIAQQQANEMWSKAPRTLVSQVRRPVGLPRLVAIERTAANRFFRPDDPTLRVGFIGRTDSDPQRLDLNAELDGAMRDPLGFLHRVSQTPEDERGSTVAPLVVLAGRRGDAERVAGRLRAVPHPLADDMAERFEQRHRRVRSRNPMAVPAVHH